MAMSKAQLYRETFEAALEFQALRPWESFDDQVCFPVRVPGSPHLRFLSVMGSGGHEYGLMVYRGPDAGPKLFEMVAGAAMDDGVADSMDMVSFGMSPLHEIPTQGREFLRAAKVSAHRTDLVPLFIAKDSGKHARALSRDEVGEMLMILRGLAKALKQGLLVPSPIEPGAPIREYTFGGDPGDPEISVADGVFPAVPRDASAIVAFPGDLGNLPRLSTSWVVGYPVLPISIDGVERTVRSLMVADLEDGYLLSGEIPERLDLQGAIAILRGTFKGKNYRKQKGLPRAVAFADRELHDAFAPTLAGLGVTCSYEPGHPLLEDVKESMSEWLRSGKTIPGAAPATVSAESGISAAVPAPDDLEGWKRADYHISKRLGETFFAGRKPPKLALARYFGTASAGSKLFEDPSRESVAGAFFGWAAMGYRSAEDRPTAAEKLLGGSLPEAERRILVGRCAARPSIFRIAAIDHGRNLILEDLLFGGSVVIADRLLSESAGPGYCIIGIVYPAGDFHFLLMTGPPLVSEEVLGAMRHLEEQGLDPSPEGISRTSHLFGRLWSWLERERARRPRVPQMVNFDGDPLEMHTAYFSVTDEAAARAALAKRPDLSFDSDGNSGSWQPPDSQRADRMPGGKVTAGSVRFESGQLVFETNSAERYRKARRWLDKIPGISFTSLEAKSLESIAAETEASPRQRAPLATPAPEELEQAQRMLDVHYMKWLDEKIPALGGKTPREACRTEKGRREVTLMIRTYPDPGGMAGIHVPRARMFKALGLQDAEVP